MLGIFLHTVNKLVEQKIWLWKSTIYNLNNKSAYNLLKTFALYCFVSVGWEIPRKMNGLSLNVCSAALSAQTVAKFGVKQVKEAAVSFPLEACC